MSESGWSAFEEMDEDEWPEDVHECGPIFISHTCDHDIDDDHDPWNEGCNVDGCLCVADWDGC